MSKKRERRPKKILFVSPTLGAGGAQRQLINIANGFHEKGYEVSIFVFFNRGKLRDSINKNIRVFFPSVPSAILKRSELLGILLATVELVRTVMKEKPEILYSRQWPKMPVAIIGRIFGAKTVSGEGNNLGHELKNRPLLLQARKFCARLSDKVVANSKSLSTETEKVFGLDSKVEVIYNGIAAEEVRKKSQEKQEHEWLGNHVPVVLAIGYFKKSRQKGFSHLLEALQIVNRRKTVRLIILGNGEKEEMIDLSKKLSIEDKVVFRDAMPNPFPYMLRTDVFVCSSLYEGLSNVILEAMALGKPIISTDHKHGADEIIEDGKNGVLVPVEDPQSMAEAIARVLDDAELREKLGAEAKKRSEYFSRARMISEYEKLFSNIKNTVQNN